MSLMTEDQRGCVSSGMISTFECTGKRPQVYHLEFNLLSQRLMLYMDMRFMMRHLRITGYCGKQSVHILMDTDRAPIVVKVAYGGKFLL